MAEPIDLQPQTDSTRLYFRRPAVNNSLSQGLSDLSDALGNVGVNIARIRAKEAKNAEKVFNDAWTMERLRDKDSIIREHPELAGYDPLVQRLVSERNGMEIGARLSRETTQYLQQNGYDQLDTDQVAKHADDYMHRRLEELGVDREDEHFATGFTSVWEPKRESFLNASNDKRAAVIAADAQSSAGKTVRTAYDLYRDAGDPYGFANFLEGEQFADEVVGLDPLQRQASVVSALGELSDLDPAQAPAFIKVVLDRDDIVTDGRMRETLAGTYRQALNARDAAHEGTVKGLKQEGELQVAAVHSGLAKRIVAANTAAAAAPPEQRAEILRQAGVEAQKFVEAQAAGSNGFAAGDILALGENISDRFNQLSSLSAPTPVEYQKLKNRARSGDIQSDAELLAIVSSLPAEQGAEISGLYESFKQNGNWFAFTDVKNEMQRLRTTVTGQDAEALSDPITKFQTIASGRSKNTGAAEADFRDRFSWWANANPQAAADPDLRAKAAATISTAVAEAYKVQRPATSPQAAPAAPPAKDYTTLNRKLTEIHKNERATVQQNTRAAVQQRPDLFGSLVEGDDTTEQLWAPSENPLLSDESIGQAFDESRGETPQQE